MYNLDGCNFTATTIQATTVIYFFTNYAILPYYVTIGLVLDLLLCIALARQTRMKQSYGYQLQLACSRTLHCLGFGLYSICVNWFGWTISTFYWLTALTVRILPTIYNTSYLLSLFLSVVITCDRVYALASPFGYKTRNHRRSQCLVALLLIVLATGASVDRYFAYDIIVVRLNGAVFYQAQANLDYVSAVWGRVSESVRDYVRAFCLLALVALNISMIILHRRRIRRIESMTNSTNEERVQARRETNKDLTILAVCQSILSCIDHAANMFGQFLWQSSAYWARCVFVVVAEVSCVIMLAGIVEFYLFVAVNRRLRMRIPGYKRVAAVCTRIMGHGGGNNGGNNRVGTTTH